MSFLRAFPTRNLLGDAARLLREVGKGVSIRAVERMTGVHGDTIMRLAVRVGEACTKIHDEKMRGLSCRQLEVDEAWGFIGKKNRNIKPGEDRNGLGDAWVFIALDSVSKLIPSFLVGKRDAYHANPFMDDLASRLIVRPQISSDALSAYPDAVERGFGANADYGQLVKTYSVEHLGNFKEAASRYSPSWTAPNTDSSTGLPARHFLDFVRHSTTKPHMSRLTNALEARTGLPCCHSVTSVLVEHVARL